MISNISLVHPASGYVEVAVCADRLKGTDLNALEYLVRSVVAGMLVPSTAIIAGCLAIEVTEIMLSTQPDTVTLAPLDVWQGLHPYSDSGYDLESYHIDIGVPAFFSTSPEVVDDEVLDQAICNDSLCLLLKYRGQGVLSDDLGSLGDLKHGALISCLLKVCDAVVYTADDGASLHICHEQGRRWRCA